ncbi:uncharacterized protein LOC112524703 [Cynara cardunculus var. scolymus]|uniref:Appr-1-p processing n=1 Tax=Cynara cardunculus var. scolymus TaxID=59895 RepID=A0A118K2S0_CYNCS|nr:uncharacterized protein LOC112524703 [Cynara cardunculus var. scolymus]KVI04816.1 Appr-1-p processing [Cynara cardunculus var. scolymus]
MPPISASITSLITSTLLSSLSNGSLNPRFIFRYTPPESRISIFVDFRTVGKRSFSVIQGNGGLRASSNMSRDGGDAGKRVAHFNLSPTSALKIQKGDITRWFIDGSSDAIVNPANQLMLGGGGADGAIHQAAGPELRTACYHVPEVRPGVRCPTGEARITPGFKLPASHVIHTVGPIYDANSNVAAFLSNAYRNSLRVARENNIQYVAFPAISCGIFGYPFEEAATVAISTIKEHCNDIKEAHFVLFSDDIYNVWLKKAEELLQN